MCNIQNYKYIFCSNMYYLQSFDADNVIFSDVKLHKNGMQSVYTFDKEQKRILIQTNVVKIKQFDDNYIHLQFPKYNEIFEQIDEKVLNFVKGHKQDVFGKELNDEKIDEIFTKSLNQTLKCKYKSCDFFDVKKNVVDKEILNNLGKCICIIEPIGIYFIKKQFGLTWNIHQMKVLPNEKLKGYSFTDELEQINP